MDGAVGYGPSFLEEAFGGLVRCEGFEKSTLDTRLKIRTARKSRERMVREDIANAIPGIAVP